MTTLVRYVSHGASKFSFKLEYSSLSLIIMTM
jgi:hypothetical protein